MDNQAVIYQVTLEPTRKTGIANIGSVMYFTGIKSRTTINKMEREGKFPKRVSVVGNRVGWRWPDLYAWADGLQEKDADQAKPPSDTHD